MNLAIISNVRFQGTVNELDPVLDAIAAALFAHGFGNDVEDDSSPVNSIIIVRENQFDGAPEDYIRSLMEGSLQVLLPTKGVENGRDGDDGATDSLDQRDASGTGGAEGLQPRSGEGVRQSAD